MIKQVVFKQRMGRRLELKQKKALEATTVLSWFPIRLKIVQTCKLLEIPKGSPNILESFS